jgi:hypothetical protein
MSLLPSSKAVCQSQTAFRSKPCILLGYAANQKGYRCLEPQSHKIYISRHVVFDETVFPAKGTSLSQGSFQVIATPGNPLVMISSHVPVEHFPSTTHSTPIPSHSIPAHSPSITVGKPFLLYWSRCLCNEVEDPIRIGMQAYISK